MLVVLLGTLLIFFGLIGKLIVDQITQFIDQAPAKSQNLEHWINRTFGTHLTNKQISKEFNDPNGPIRGFATHLAGNALGFSLSALDVIFRFFTILLFTFYLVADGPRFRRLICSFMRPDRQREVLANWEVAIQKTGGYLYSRLLLGIIQAVFHYIAFVVIGVPVPAGPGPVRGRRVPVRAGGRHLHRQRLPGADRPGRRSGQGPVGGRSSPSCSNRSRTTSWPRASRPGPCRCTRRWPSARCWPAPGCSAPSAR